MDLDQQRKFFLLEFSSWADRFLTCMTFAIVALLGIVSAQTFFSIGGVDAQYLVYTYGLLVLAVGAQFLVFWARIGRGFRVSGITLWFLPWMALLAADMFWFSGTPWRAQYAFCVNMLPLMAFFVSIHVSRTKRSRWWLIALTAMLTLISGLSEFLKPGEEAQLALESGGGLASTVREIFSTFGCRAGIGAVLLLAFFAMALLVVSPRFKLWARLFGLYMAILFLLGIAFTRHVGVYAGLVAGGVLAVWLLVRRRPTRVVLWCVLAVLAPVLFYFSDKNVGCFKTVEISPEIRKNFTEEELGTGTRYLLPHAAWEMFKKAPVLGVGGGCFTDAFEQYRTPQWQTNPKTAGSLYLTVLAEHGIVGLVLFIAPLGLMLFFGVRACRRLPWYADTERAALRRKMGIIDLGSLPEERIALAGMICGLLSVGVLFAIDYPRNIPGVSVSCGIFGGIAGLLLSAARQRVIIFSGPRRHVLLPVAFLVPVLLLSVFLPTFRAEAEYQKGLLVLKPFYSSQETGLPEEQSDFSDLAKAERHLRSALRKAPEHGDAWNALSAKYIFDCQRDPMNVAEYAAFLRTTSARALSCSDLLPQSYRMRATAEMMVGDFSAVEKSLARAVEAAPFNAPHLLMCAEIYSAFPQGVAKASPLLDRLAYILPKSQYIERMRALISFGDGFSKDGNEKPEVGENEYVIPEF